jgi:hypothetical protein
MTHIIEVERHSEAEARSFLDALYYSASVSAIGFRPQDEKFIAIAVNWDAEETSDLDERISRLITDSLQTCDDLDEISAYFRIFPKTVRYNPERQAEKLRENQGKINSRVR